MLIEWNYDSTAVPNDRDEDSGKFREQYPTESFLKAVDELNMATTSKVAESVGCSYDLAYRRLTALAEEGQVVKSEVGGSLVWSEPQLDR